MATAFTFGTPSSVSSNTQNDAKKFELELLKNKTEFSKSQIEFKKFEIELTKSNIELEKVKEVTKVKQLDVSLAKIQANKEIELARIQMNKEIELAKVQKENKETYTTNEDGSKRVRLT